MLLAFAILVVALKPADASCYEPTAPSCATRYGAFDDQDDFDRCRRAMNSYKSETEDYLACIRRESDHVIEDYNSAVQSFNRRARG
jgi:hypothetical protein